MELFFVNEKVKMQHKWFKAALLIVVSVTRVILSEDLYLADFKNEVENLLLNTTDEALQMSINVYNNLTSIMTPQLRAATNSLIGNYLEMAKQSLECHANYTEKRILLKYFRMNNWKIDRLRMKLEPETKEYQFHVISKDFYFDGRNTTIFDNLYLKFIQKFEKASEVLWKNLSEDVVENEQELLELLDEISKEQVLAEKDRLYDEFIEMFLFKSEKERLETRELE